ncbi:MAG: hypothetical protein KUL75_10915 [Sterolibacterium sp.]|nr:hypothetical protein [Sterolibacterium sp.]
MPGSRRHSLQLPLLSHAEVEFRGMTCSGLLRDASLSGALFSFSQSPRDSTLLRPCRLHLADDGPVPGTCFNGLVIHVNADILGIKFIGMREKERLALLQLFNHHLVEPCLLDRDLTALLKDFSNSKHE